jgi:microsomal prostaglandin-E synthase 2
LRALQWVVCRFGSGKAEGSSSIGGVSAEEERLWRKWVDERFVKVLTANIYRSWE